MRIIDFVKQYLKVLNISQKKFAAILQMKDSSLHKYLVGDRKLNADLVLKLSAFLDTKPETWYHIQTKNELFELRKEKEKIKAYKKLSYKNYVNVK